MSDAQILITLQKGSSVFIAKLKHKTQFKSVVMFTELQKPPCTYLKTEIFLHFTSVVLKAGFISIVFKVVLKVFAAKQEIKLNSYF